MYRSLEETKVSTKQREPYYVHNATGRRPLKRPTPPRTSTSTAHSDNDAASTISAPLVNPKHPPEICPPSTSRWQKMKDENEQRKSREVARVSLEEAAKRSGRDQRGFKIGEEHEWTESQKDVEPKRSWQCMVM